MVTHRELHTQEQKKGVGRLPGCPPKMETSSLPSAHDLSHFGAILRSHCVVQFISSVGSYEYCLSKVSLASAALFLPDICGVKL